MLETVSKKSVRFIKRPSPDAALYLSRLYDESKSVRKILNYVIEVVSEPGIGGRPTYDLKVKNELYSTTEFVKALKLPRSSVLYGLNRLREVKAVKRLFDGRRYYWTFNENALRFTLSPIKVLESKKSESRNRNRVEKVKKVETLEETEDSKRGVKKNLFKSFRNFLNLFDIFK